MLWDQWKLSFKMFPAFLHRWTYTTQNQTKLRNKPQTNKQTKSPNQQPPPNQTNKQNPLKARKSNVSPALWAQLLDIPPNYFWNTTLQAESPFFKEIPEG